VTNLGPEKLGLTIYYQVEAFNLVGSTKSESAAFLFAAVPPAPAQAPWDDPDVTTSEQIKVSFAAVEALAETGGSQILEYELSVDDAAATFATYSTSEKMALTFTVQAVEGNTYAFRYRVRNIYGWSQYSGTTFILAASVPAPPLKPTFVGSTNNAITVALHYSLNANGADITEYELEMDDGDRNFVSLSSYRNFAIEHTVTYAADGVESGKVYAFRFRAQNSKGWSEYSEQTLIAAVNAPQKAATPQVDYTKSTSSSVFMTW
jgi:hypothetical protein